MMGSVRAVIVAFDNVLAKDVEEQAVVSEEEVLEKDEGLSQDLKTSEIVDLCSTRSGHIFVTITLTSLCVWQTRKPTVLLARFSRSQSSLNSYGANQTVLIRSDSTIAVVKTSLGYLMTYFLIADPVTRVYQQQHGYSQARRQGLARHFGTDDGEGFGEVSIRFRVAIKIDAGISAALALDNELIVATKKPAAVQCIKWLPDGRGSQTTTELLSKMDWLPKKSGITSMVYDRAMNLAIWITEHGTAYAAQRLQDQVVPEEPVSSGSSSEEAKMPSPKKMFHGYLLHEPSDDRDGATIPAINARFSLLAVGCSNGDILVYSAKDYAGNLPFSHKLQSPASPATTGSLMVLSYSPDGYCIFAGYEKGWAMWSVFGKPGAHSFESNQTISQANDEAWLQSIRTACWVGGGSEILLTTKGDNRIWNLEIARSAATGCFSCANLVRALLQTPSEVVIYRGHDLPDLTTISGEASLWHHAQYPPTYVHNQWPIRSCVISQDGRYVAIAGRRGLAHYSLQSGRWKTFSDPTVENSFAVRGGMCWYGHVLIVAAETDTAYELRLYSRDAELGRLSTLHIEPLPAPAIFIGPSGEDSLLVYTYDNILYHYVIDATPRGVNLVQVGQIAFHGVVRAPTRVRAVSWVLPEHQLRNGDPSQDVAVASVLFLVDDKLVLLQPSQTEEGTLRYDMRSIKQSVEYYILMRDQLYFNFAPIGDESTPPSPAAENALNGQHFRNALRDSLWTFTGDSLHMWNDVQEVLRMALEGPALKDNLALLDIPVDFYPLSILLNKGLILGIESELLQRRDVTFSLFRYATRTSLFIPKILRYQLSQQDTPAALALIHQYESITYLPHALEILLHEVLDDEVDNPPIPPARSLLPIVLTFLQSSTSPATYLDIILQCTRKTELRSWRTLFAHLPPPEQLFEQAMEMEELKIAGGYLLILQGLTEDDEAETDEDSKSIRSDTSSVSATKWNGNEVLKQVIRVMRLGKQKCDWDICTELAGFLIALDPRGNALRKVMDEVGFSSNPTIQTKSPSETGIALQEQRDKGLMIPNPRAGSTASRFDRRASSSAKTVTGTFVGGQQRQLERVSYESTSTTGDITGASDEGGDYFSASPGSMGR
ncbi:hypothetical protein UCRPC4_g01247 [Phaeomoniella chlamydospora]|uniref:RIC1 C-terminal alpha solenoid region domain-containing protein n=1 Tax=Phaeomoniella chlamydospora TaxID=158046 RepID=A0A0G2GV29_PHACM|nr:hypothetical protein UCRPC4_g01247 [Phaeomoniella chlamydospora]